MAALAADINVSSLGTPLKAEFSCNAADTHYQGSIVYVDTAGGAQVTAAAGDRVVGISTTKQVTTAAGQLIEVYINGLFWVPLGTNIAAADEGERLVSDGPTNSDNFADMVAAGDITLAANDACVGRIIRVTATQMLIAIGPDTGQLFVSIATTPASGYWD